MDEIEVFEESPGRFVVHGAGQYQPFDPEQPGFVPMSRDRAEEVAAAFREALKPRQE